MENETLMDRIGSLFKNYRAEMITVVVVSALLMGILVAVAR